MNKDGISYINNNILINISDDKQLIPIIYGKKPSIECHFHSILKKYVVHIHPAFINGILCDMNAKDIINGMNIEYKILILDYIKPGIDIKTKIYCNYNDHDIIFLLNHGIIVHSNNMHDLDNIMYNLFNKFNLYNIAESITINNMFNQPICIYQTYNTIIINNISETFYNICPDYTLYLNKPFIFKTMNDFIFSFKNINIPCICKINNNIYIIDTNIKKCKYLEDLYCGYLITLSNINEYKLLNNSEVNSIIKRDDEIYRKNI
jgi:hypothetical protein